jgi:hypothetical protein
MILLILSTIQVLEYYVLYGRISESKFTGPLQNYQLSGIQLNQSGVLNLSCKFDKCGAKLKKNVWHNKNTAMQCDLFIAIVISVNITTKDRWTFHFFLIKKSWWIYSLGSCLWLNLLIYILKIIILSTQKCSSFLNCFKVDDCKFINFFLLKKNEMFIYL